MSFVTVTAFFTDFLLLALICVMVFTAEDTTRGGCATTLRMPETLTVKALTDRSFLMLRFDRNKNMGNIFKLKNAFFAFWENYQDEWQRSFITLTYTYNTLGMES